MEGSRIPKPVTAPASPVEQRPYDMRRLSYAGTFKNPVKANAIRAIEWSTGKLKLLRLIRQYERSGVPFGQPFWPKAIAASVSLRPEGCAGGPCRKRRECGCRRWHRTRLQSVTSACTAGR